MWGLMTKQKLQCPWCKARAVIDTDIGAIFWIKCRDMDCQAQGPFRSSKEEAMEDCNKVIMAEKQLNRLIDKAILEIGR